MTQPNEYKDGHMISQTLGYSDRSRDCHTIQAVKGDTLRRNRVLVSLTMLLAHWSPVARKTARMGDSERVDSSGVAVELLPSTLRLTPVSAH